MILNTENLSSNKSIEGSSSHADVVGHKSGENGSVPLVPKFDSASERYYSKEKLKGPSIDGDADSEAMIFNTEKLSSDKSFEGSSNHADVMGYQSGESGSVPLVPKFEGALKRYYSKKKLKGTSIDGDVMGCRSRESRRMPSVSEMNTASLRAAGGSEGSSVALDDNAKQEFSATRKRTSAQILADGNSNSTNQKVSPNALNASPGVASASMVGPKNVQEVNSIQDEDELRKERRKQANRESSKRSRLRKKEECKELEEVAKALKSDTSQLRQELLDLSNKCMEFANENKSIMEELIETCGSDAIADLEVKYPDFFQQYVTDKSSSMDRETQSHHEH